MRKLALCCVTVTGSATAAGAASAQDAQAPALRPAPDRLTDLATYIAESLRDWNLPGLAVAVVHEGEVVFAQGFGVKEVGRDDRIDARTLFQIGSVTKSFAAAAIGALVDEGLAGWDDPVVDHLPWFRVKDPWITREITLRDLLSHQSGMPGAAYPVLAVVSARETAEGLRLLDNQGPLRQGYRYSNQAYAVAGLVVEAAAGMSWGAWVREQLLGPLEMRNTGTSPYDVWDSAYVAPTFLGSAPAGVPGIADAPRRNVAMPHGVDRDGNRRVLSWQSYDNMQAAGSVVSNVVDMANWLRMQLDHGRFNGTTVLDSTTVSEMHVPLVRTPSTFVFADPGTGSYGLGWARASFLGHTYISHGGGIFGFPAYAAMLPELQAGVVVLANGSMWTPYYPHQEIAAWVFARLLGIEGRDWHGEVMARTEAVHDQVEAALNAREAARIDGTRPSLALADYAGRYEDEYGAATAHVVYTDTGLRVHFGAPGSFSGKIEHWHHDVFQVHYDGGDGQAYGSSFVTFTIGPDGSVAQMDMGFMGRYRRVR
ncbi:MAG: serine hydrolase [Gemmatimonadota bacterium]|nr:serine hydrolase [Gemmatimonadota bacterium]